MPALALLSPDLAPVVAGRNRPAPAPAPLTTTLATAIDAGPAGVLDALRRADLGALVVRAVAALGVAGRVALFPTPVGTSGGAALGLGMIARVTGGLPDGIVPPGSFAVYSAPGHVKVRWDFVVRPGADGQSFLSIRTRFEATDRRSHERLLGAWAVVGPLAASLAARAAAAVRAAAEEDGAE